MIDMVLDAIDAIYQFANSWTGPEVGRKPVRTSSAKQSLQEVRTITWRQLGLAPRMWFESNRVLPVIVKTPQRQLRPSPRTIEEFGDLRQLYSLTMQLYGFEPDPFQVLWASMPSHEQCGSTLSKTRKYQCRNQ